ncbi:MAG: hypothetical protein J6J18_12405 [Oscillospiraceae bacterium]|nr:hypothetical protein [Oscillospiraceae bacterium]
MKKLKNLWLGIPRWVRAIGNMVLVLLIAVVFYVCIGAPTLTEEQAFRRAEKAQLVGPSTILFIEDVESYDYRHLILAETDYGVVTYVSDETWDPKLCYTAKTGDVTVVAAPKGPFKWGYSNWAVKLPVFVVDDVPGAVRAELEIDIVGTYVINLNGEKLQIPLDHHYSLESTREEENFFQFAIELPFVERYDGYTYIPDAEAEHGADGYALDLLAEAFSNQDNQLPRSNASITATVRLYNESDELIVEQDLTLREMTESNDGGANDED